MTQYKLPVTTILKIKPKAGSEKECLQWMHKTAIIASNFEGFVSKEIYKSVEEESFLVNIFTFKTFEQLKVWENSTQLKEQIKQSELFIESIVAKNQLMGLEFWFRSAATNQSPPVKWKIVLVTVVVIFSLLNTLVPVLQIGFNALGFPILLKSFVGVLVMVCLMTYVIMPFITKWLGRWLF